MLQKRFFSLRCALALLGLTLLATAGLAIADDHPIVDPKKYVANPALIQRLKEKMPCYDKGGCLSVIETIAETPLDISKALDLVIATFGRPASVRKEPSCIATYYVKDNVSFYTVEVAPTASDKTYARYSVFNNTDIVNKQIRLENAKTTNKRMRKMILLPINK